MMTNKKQKFVINDTNFGAFILTHGRPDKQDTITALRRQGYTGKIYLIIDDQDTKGGEYYTNSDADDVFCINSAEVAKTLDICDSMGHYNSVVYKRMASFDIAERLGITYFIQLDDDYHAFYYRRKRGKHLDAIRIKDLNKVFEVMIEWMETSNADTVAMAQGGELIGGIGSALARNEVRRKAMNSWMLKTDRRLQFIGRLNDDVNTYVMNGIWGKLIMTPYCLSLAQGQTQFVEGGMTSLYLDTGTYMKSFYTVMMAPSCVSVRRLGPTHPRAHHHIEWNNCVPKIINEAHRKPR